MKKVFKKSTGFVVLYVIKQEILFKVRYLLIFSDSNYVVFFSSKIRREVSWVN